MDCTHARVRSEICSCCACGPKNCPHIGSTVVFPAGFPRPEPGGLQVYVRVPGHSSTLSLHRRLGGPSVIRTTTAQSFSSMRALTVARTPSAS